MKYKSMTKSQLAAAAGITRQTFCNWLKPHEKKLRKMGVSPCAKVLPPVAVKYVCQIFDIDI